MKRIFGCACVLFLCAAAGCSQIPKVMEGPQIRVSAGSASDSRIITLEGGIYNDNGSVAYSDYSALAVLKGKDGKVIVTIPVRADRIFPFMAVKLSGEAVVGMADFEKIAAEFAVEDPAAAKRKTSAEDDAVQIPEDRVMLEKISCRKQQIDKLLREGAK